MKKTTDKFKDEIFSLVGNEYEVIGEYLGSREYINIRHNVCGFEYKTKPYAFTSNGSRCPKCFGNKRYTTKSFTFELNEKHKNEYSVIGEYVNSKTNIDVIHNVCGYLWNVNPNVILKGKAYCPRCSKKEKIDTRKFINKLNKITNEYDVVGKYINANTNIDIIHNKCGSKLSMRPSVLLNGGGCKYCYGNVKKTTNIFKKEVFDLTNGEYTILSEYVDARKKVKFKHNECEGYFFMSPTNFISGNRCPICKKSKGEKRIRDVLEKK